MCHHLKIVADKSLFEEIVSLIFEIEKVRAEGGYAPLLHLLLERIFNVRGFYTIV
jgi:hypothetical protein